MYKKIFEHFNKPYREIKEVRYENRKETIYTDYKDGIEGAKIIYSYDIHSLNKEEIMALKIFNEIFAEGTSSILFHNIRTINSLAYDVGSNFKNERGIKLFDFYIGTSKEKVSKAINIMDKILEGIIDNKEYFTKERICRALKSIKLKKAIRHEMSIRLALDITTSELMYNDSLNINGSIEDLSLIKEENIKKVLKKIFKSKVIQILQ